jgi:hypothetical protein
LSQSPTTTDRLGGLQTAAEALTCSPTIVDQLADMVGLPQGIDLTKNHSFDESLYANQSKSVQAGHAKFEYTVPNADFSSEKLKGNTSGGVSGELTALEISPELKIGEIGKFEPSWKVGTVNAHAKFETKAQLDVLNLSNSELSAKGSVGAEAMAWNARYSVDVSITPKTVGDTLSGFYNDMIDPVVDYIAGQDVPEIPPTPDYLDHGIVFGGHAASGLGISGKVGGGLEIGDGKLFKGSFHVKGGIGAVIGFGATLGLK